MSEQMPEITEEDARLLEGLAELAETDPEGYQALIEDLGGEDDPARAHGQFLLAMFEEGNKHREEEALSLLTQAWRAELEGGQEEDKQE